jgi:hypothetical protein
MNMPFQGVHVPVPEDGLLMLKNVTVLVVGCYIV